MLIAMGMSTCMCAATMILVIVYIQGGRGRGTTCQCVARRGVGGGRGTPMMLTVYTDIWKGCGDNMSIYAITVSKTL